VAIGANVIERHFKYSRNSNEGPDIVLSSDEKEMQYIIDITRKIEKAKGDGIKIPSKSEYKNRKTNRVSICAIQDISQNTVITSNMIDIRRPGSGIEPKFFEQVIGRVARKNILADEPLTWDVV